MIAALRVRVASQTNARGMAGVRQETIHRNACKRRAQRVYPWRFLLSHTYSTYVLT
jgi:hypothetical protein